MMHIFILALTGFAIGTLGTLIGAGGGFILVPLLLLTYKELPPVTVTAISMAVVAANAISGSAAYARAHRIDYRAGITFALFTIPGSILGVFTVSHVSLDAFHKMFGVLLLLIGGYLFVRNSRRLHKEHTEFAPKPGAKQYTITDRKGTSYTYSYDRVKGILISIVVGFLSPVLGIGGGIIHVPAMVSMLHFPLHIATATSHFILAVMATVTVVTHLLNGSYSSHDVQVMILGLCIGIIPGAQLGAWLSHRLHSSIVIRLLAVSLAIVGLRMLVL